MCIVVSPTLFPSLQCTCTGAATDFKGCLHEVDDVWSIVWPNTMFNHLSIQPCPNRDGHNVMGNILYTIGQ